MNQDSKKFRYGALTTSDGSISLDFDFSRGDFSDDEQQRALGLTTALLVRKMFEDGWVRLLSSSDISKIYGNSRQYWDKLFREGKIPFQKTASGKITTNFWVEGYLDDSTGETYPKEVLEMRRRIVANERSGSGLKHVPCIRCGEHFQYNYNQGSNITGICKCGFRLDTVE